MIEISHQRAQYLIRQSADKRLPEEQWAALQAHLEGCPACRAYRDRQSGIERGLRRLWSARWREMHLTSSSLPHGVHSFRSARKQRVRRTAYSMLGLLAFALLALLGLPRRALSPEPMQTPTRFVPSPTAEPAERFQGIVAFPSRIGGDSEIYLIEAIPNGAWQTNLTQNPAEDTDPAWSPDGEWIAFLSDRTSVPEDAGAADGTPAQGKRELYVISVAGTRLTQLTDAPDIDWQGPLSWSDDGLWIALTGRRLKQDGEAYTYLVPIDGSDPVSLAGTRGTPGYPRFSPLAPLLAAPTNNGGILTFNTRYGWSSQAVRGAGLPAFAGNWPITGWFDWAYGGDSLLYLGDGPEENRILMQGVTGPRLSMPGTDEEAQLLARSGVALFDSLTFQPGGMTIAVLQDERGMGCWNIQFMHAFLYENAQVVRIPDLCILNVLDRGNWTPRGTPGSTVSWLVVAAYPRDKTDGPGIYALQVPVLLAPAQPRLYQRLADLTQGETSIPAVRPIHSPLNLHPGPAASPAEPLPEASPPVGMQGNLLLVQPEEGSPNQSLVRLDPDGQNEQVLLQPSASVRCPAYSPDRSRIVFLSDQAARETFQGEIRQDPNQVLPEEVFVMDADGGNVTQITQAHVTGRATNGLSLAYSCPVWSPDGKYLAVTSQVGFGSGVMVMTPEGQVVRYVPSDPIAPYTNVTWMPDGQSILLAQPALRSSAPRIVRVPWREPVASNTLMILDGWEDVQALSVSPDGKQLAFILMRESSGSRLYEAHLRLVSLPDMQILYDKELPGYDAHTLYNPGHIAWLQDHQIVFAIPQAPLSHSKARILRYVPTEDTVQELADTEDVLYDWVLNGPWLVYSTESGIWGAPVDGRLDLPGAPLRLRTQPASSLAWR